MDSNSNLGGRRLAGRGAGLDGLFGNSDAQRTARTIRVIVDAADDLPPSRNEAMQIVVGMAAVTVDVLVNEDSDNPNVGEPLRVFFAEPPSSGGRAELQGNLRSLRYTPAAGFVGTETVRYYVTDGRHDPVLATLSVTVVPNVTINLTTNQKVVVQTSGGNMQVLINGVIDSSFSTIPAASVQSLTINGGTGDNLIDLRGVTLAANAVKDFGVAEILNGVAHWACPNGSPVFALPRN